MAMEAYQMEGDEMYRQFGMFSELDDKEYNRNIAAYDATYQHRNQLYNEAYSQFRDEKNDAFALGNLQLSEHGQRVSDAYNYYNIASDQANTQYNREYAQWTDSVNQAYQMMQMQNSDWQNQANRDFQATEAEKERAFTASENAKNRAAQAAKKSDDGYYASETQKEEALEAYINGGIEGLTEYVDSQKGGMNTKELMKYVEGQTVPTGTTIKKTKNTWNGFFGIGGLTGHIDTNDEYEITYPGEKEPKKVKAADLPESIRSKIDNLKENESITW